MHMNLNKKLSSLLPTITNNNILNSILDELESYLIQLESQYEEAYMKEFGRLPSEYEIRDFFMGTLYKLINSVEKYLKSTDILIEINSEYRHLGTTVNAIIERDGVRYSFETEVILAGGYNIQSLHNRYIVRTKLPKTNNDEVSNSYKTKIKKLQGAKKIQDDINDYQRQINRIESEIKVNSKLSDDEILSLVIKEKGKGQFPKWSDLNEGGKENFINYWNNNEVQDSFHFKSRLNPTSSIILTTKEIADKFKDAADFFDNYIIPNRKKQSIEHWKFINVIWESDRLKIYNDEILKLQNKLNKYL